jgi:amino acid permease
VAPLFALRRPTIQAVEMLLIIVIVLLLIWTPGYYGYGRSRWGLGNGGHLLTLILVIVLLWALFGGRL